MHHYLKQLIKFERGREEHYQELEVRVLIKSDEDQFNLIDWINKFGINLLKLN